MSIETERWVYDIDGVLRYVDTHEPVPLYEYRKEAQVLPEALALLKRIHEQSSDWGEAEDILRRAGVLK